MQNRFCDLLKIDFPIIQAGMVWCSGWKLASAVSKVGGLGVIGSGSMSPDVLREHIQKLKKSTDKPFAVNVPLLYAHSEKNIAIIVEEKVPIVITSAGNPAQWTSFLKEKGITVIHVVSSVKFALKAEKCGVDALVAEGFEAGGHNGREETTTLCLIPAVSEAVQVPVIAAGGIASGKSMLAAFALGAEAVQIGSRFAIAEESSAHKNFKDKVLSLNEGETKLMLKQLAPVRLIKNGFFNQVQEAEMRGASVEELKTLLGKGRSRKGIFEGELEEGELEIGQIASCFKKAQTAAEIFTEIWEEFVREKKRLGEL